MLRGFDLPGYVSSNLPSVLGHMTLSMAGVSGGASLDWRKMGADLSLGDKGRIGGGATFSDGGYVDRLYVPKGDDGIAALKFGEGILNTDAMAMLAKLNRGEWPTPTAQPHRGGEVHMNIVLVVDGRQVAEASIPHLLEASRNGQHVVYADGVRQSDV